MSAATALVCDKLRVVGRPVIVCECLGLKLMATQCLILMSVKHLNYNNTYFSALESPQKELFKKITLVLETLITAESQRHGFLACIFASI